MKRYLQVVAAMAVLSMVLVACGGGESSGTGNTPSASGSGEIPTGGTLHTAMTQDFFYGLDPTQEYYAVSWEFLRCCMARTMMSYTGTTAEEGGGVPQPDLSDGEPTVSEDELTWTFKIKQGAMFGDPLNRQIVAQDFVNAINRLEDPKINTVTYPFYYTNIDGFTWPDGDADVPGMVAKDDQTLEVHLTAPQPDIPFLFAMAASAPIPTELIDTHYDSVDLGQFLVSSGPYQWEGMEGLDLKGKEPPSGMNIGRSYVFVRNPMYDASTDGLRPAYLDSIEIQVGGEVQDLLDKVDAGAIDWCIDCGLTATTLQAYSADPALMERVHNNPGDALAYTGLNIFQPPMDDVHVRKALNWAIDKAALLRQIGGEVAGGVIAGHFIPPGMMGGLNADYDPYATPDNRGDPEAAKAEMAQSKYDTDQDGVCDDPSCNVVAYAVTNDNDAIKSLEIMSDSFEAVGITLEIKTLNYNTLVDRCSTLAGHTALCQAGWGKDYPSPYTFFYPLLDGGENGSNYSFMGTTAEALQKEGYDVPAELPNITDDITACQATPVGDEQNQCWADLDKHVMEDIVPLIPRRFPNYPDVLGARIVSYSYDQFTDVGAVDHFAVSDTGA